MTSSAETRSPSDDGLWLTIADLAREKGVSRQSIHERVARLAEAGKLEVRTQGRAKLVNLAAYDLAVGEVGDPAKEQGATTKAEAQEAPLAAAPTQPGYRDAQTRKTQYEADLKEIELKEKLGELVPVADLSDAASQVAERIVRAIDRLPAAADDMAAAVARDGTLGARAQYKRDARGLRQAVVEAMRDLAKATIEISADVPSDPDTASEAAAAPPDVESDP